MVSENIVRVSVKCLLFKALVVARKKDINMDCSFLIRIWIYNEYVLAIQRLETHKLRSQTNVYTSWVITETGISGSPTFTLEQVLHFFGVESIFNLLKETRTQITSAVWL